MVAKGRRGRGGERGATAGRQSEGGMKCRQSAGRRKEAGGRFQVSKNMKSFAQILNLMVESFDKVTVMEK